MRIKNKSNKFSEGGALIASAFENKALNNSIPNSSQKVNKNSSANTDNKTDTKKVAATKLRPAYFELLTYIQNHPNATMEKFSFYQLPLVFCIDVTNIFN